MGKEVNVGITAYLPFSTKDISGALVDADSLPTITNTQVNGQDESIAGTSISQSQDSVPSNITGRYIAEIPTAGLSANDQVEVMISATIGGVTVEHSLCFIVINDASQLPSIESC